MTKKNIVIDASTIRSGGGMYHLGQLLQEIDRQDIDYPIKLKECIVSSTFIKYSLKFNLSNKIREILTVTDIPNFIYPIYQLIKVSNRVKKFKDPIFLVLAAFNFIRSNKVYIMTQNLLPSDFQEIKKYGFSKEAFRLLTIRYLNFFAFKRSKKIIFISHYALTKTLKCFKKTSEKNKIKSKSVVNYLPIQTSKNYRNLSNENLGLSKHKKFKFLYVSRVDHYKNHDYVIDEIDSFKKKNNTKFTFICAGEIYNPYFKKYKKLFNKKWLTFTGEISHDKVLKLYQSSDIGIFASTCESCPTIILEMMMYGLPFVVCDLPLYDEIVPSIYPRFTIGEKGSLDKAIDKVLSDKKFLNEMICIGRKKIKEFNTNKSISNLIYCLGK